MSNIDLEKALTCLRSGEVIITPSESCYGFSCDATSERAVAEIKALKQSSQAFTILISDLKQLEPFGILNDTADRLSKAFHPGQLNIIVDLSDVHKYRYLSEDGIAFRIPSHPLLLDLIARFDGPITTTSANAHGSPALYRIAEVRKQFGASVCSIIDTGDLDPTIQPSTVYDSRTHKVLRHGPISEGQLRAVIS